MNRQTRRAKRGGAVAISLVAAASLMAACARAPDGVATASNATARPTGDTKVVGTAESVDDVGTQDPAPMGSDRSLLVLPRAEAERLWELIDHTPSDSELPYVGGLLEDSDVEQWQLIPVAEGRFGLDAPDGAYLVCLLSGGFVLTGCAAATVTGPTTWAVTHGEGGFEIRG